MPDSTPPSVKFGPNSEVLPLPSVAVAVSAVLPVVTLTPDSVRLPLKAPLASAVSVPM